MNEKINILKSRFFDWWNGLIAGKNLSDKRRWEKDYNRNLCIDCPYCGKDRPDHSCGNCYSDMSKAICWKLGGYCSEKCKRHITEELPRFRKEKLDAGIKCLCDDPNCAKCLLIKCIDPDCPTHPKNKKEDFKKGYENR